MHDSLDILGVDYYSGLRAKMKNQEPISLLDKIVIDSLLSDKISSFSPKPGPKNGERYDTFKRDFNLYAEYEARKLKGNSESLYAEFCEREGFKDRSSVIKALDKIRQLIKQQHMIDGGIEPMVKGMIRAKQNRTGPN